MRWPAPFAALASTAALNVSRRDLITLIGAAWLANQIIGYVFLAYPMTWHSFAWGGALGMAASLGTVGALAAVAWSYRVTGGSRPPPVPTEPDVQISSRGLFGS